MRQVVNSFEHDVLATVLNLSLCSATDIVRLLVEKPTIEDVSRVTTVLRSWTKEGALGNADDTYAVRPEKKLPLQNELLRYEATTPAEAIPLSFRSIAPDAAETLSVWEDMVLNLESGNVPEKDHALYFQGIVTIARALLQRLERTFTTLTATEEATRKLWDRIDGTMLHFSEKFGRAPEEAAAASSRQKGE